MIFKKKPIYILGIVLFTLVLLADLVIYFAVPAAGNWDTVPNMGGSFDAESFEGMMPDGFDAESFGSGRPDGSNFGGEMPDMGSDATMPNRTDDSNFAGGFDSTNRPNRGQMGTADGNGFLSAIRSWFWPILIICILADGLCIFMLIRISRSNRKEEEPEEENEDSRSRRDPTNTWLAVIAVILVGAVTLTGLPSGSSANAMEANTSVQQAEAAVADIAGVFSGSGTLLSSDADTVELPATVKITSYTVKNGDTVQVGQTIAHVDKTSVLKAIYEVQSLITEMDAELAEVQSDTLADEITARADGRVKAIYVSKGDSIAAAMYEHGAVILIALGGSMTVEIESEETVSVGQSMTVTLSDDSQIEGKVQQVRDGKITVTTTDDGPTPDDTVSVATEDGTVLGSGTLRIASPMKVTGFFGTVDKIKVKVGDDVEAGDTLLTLQDTEDLARYQQLLRQRQELTALLSELNVMYQEGTVKASAAGVVTQIDEDVEYLPLSAAANGGYTASNMAASSSSSGYITDPAEGSEPAGPDAPPSGDAEPPVQTPSSGVFAGKVTKVTYGALQIRISETDMTGITAAELENMEESLFTAEQQYAPDLDVAVNLYRNGQTVPSSVNAIQAGDRVLLYVENGVVTQIDLVVGTGATTPSQGGTPGGNLQFPSAGGSFSSPSSTTEEEELAVYEVTMTALCAITPAETMTIDILVDELDILTLAAGQEATVTLDALPGQSFIGTVKKINPTGTNEGGSTKYTVTMEVPRTEQMLDGMNASVLVEVSRLDAVLTVPAAAVYEDGNRTYVYTALAEESGEPAVPVDVVTGASDGTSIQILSGLSQGDTVYYHYADSIVVRFG